MSYAGWFHTPVPYMIAGILVIALATCSYLEKRGHL